ncbi:MAG: hypothetical protein ACREN4_06270, partial [Candidatus Dormibacteria bacterium]
MASLAELQLASLNCPTCPHPERLAAASITVGSDGQYQRLCPECYRVISGFSQARERGEEIDRWEVESKMTRLGYTPDDVLDFWRQLGG